MKLGVMSALFGGWEFEKALAYCSKLGLGAIELPAGCYPGTPFFDPRCVLDSQSEQKAITSRLAEHGLTLSALAVHGNAVHPNPEIAQVDHDQFVVAVKLARKLGTDTVITFSGCPGGAPGDSTPNWVTSAWPNDFQDIQHYQWNKVLIPYWAEQAKLAHNHGVRVAWEPHPGFTVHNPDAVIRLAEAAMKASGLAGPSVLGANLDPSHFFWQGIDPVIAARALGEAGLLFHVHAKDTELDRIEGPLNGYLDPRPYNDLKRRAWSFRACGYGHGDEFWKPFVTMLRRYGYDGSLSIEHEDAYMSLEEGFEKSVTYLKTVLMQAPPATPWWT